tara:strand:- start:5491 stop:5667 length:177 start_codon:yes stop_codon:yes gene_type:complete
MGGKVVLKHQVLNGAKRVPNGQRLSDKTNTILLIINHFLQSFNLPDNYFKPPANSLTA